MARQHKIGEGEAKYWWIEWHNEFYKHMDTLRDLREFRKKVLWLKGCFFMSLLFSASLLLYILSIL